MQTIQNLTWQDWLTAIGFIFGIVSLIAYWEQKRANKQQETFFEFAKRHVDKDITDEQLKLLLAQKLSMENQVVQQIPSLARMAVLKEQAELHNNAMTENYVQWKKITDEIAAKENVSSIDPKIEALIVDRILPQYEIRRLQETVRTRVTVISVSMARASSVLPFPIRNLIVYLLAIPLAGNLLRLFSMQDDFQHYIPWIRIISYAVYVCGIALLIGYGYFFIYYIKSESAVLFGKFLFVIGIIVLLFIPFAKKSIDKFMDNLAKTNKITNPKSRSA
jgi:hypothetical protein